ncbi:MAG: glycosyltransferase family 2 protein [Gemmatimonadetes bacterium]|uniref:Glycosyltransferase family 2 protein n=1 Tax=Candidatus Kutchimonas denitrificans TaxID=3056748 RepID=A0AAE4Z7C2_9BACT|nr:glycosyltransferase family 2 protein [Gemmatimonadota bacterium]NIR75099.1 glycosyltransferase family 2 protein [Candidatus Kutchimonas denitrificans]NIS00931.1 glycosyltransferase family 2 protein [Gemmatimonadota bacterium]NIT66548.1 glycosyltransferase family 2 protein [Gemmatimonadota bacterium]NIU52894.1 glycosyltransferase [Gemmatimonadota bacterium]
MPALNEEGVIGATLDSIPAGLVDVVYVADNGSRDGTAAEARAHGARTVREERRGYGSACQAALRALAGSGGADVVVFLDADGSEPAEELGAVLAPIVAVAADLVIGCRRFGATPAHVSIGNRLACAILRWLAGHRFHDLGPLRAIRFGALQRLALRDPDYGWNVEMQARALAVGLRVVEVPISHRARRAGSSKISGSLTGTLKAGAKIIVTAVREGWHARRALRARDS